MSEGIQWLLAAGQEIDHYRIVRPLGRGGMAEVYLARDTQLGRKVALKILLPERFSSPRGVERFLFEARATARFNHPHIVTIHGVGKDAEERPYVALEFLEGQTLLERMQDGPPGVWESIRYGVAIAEAVAEAHREGILHRDLKPDNVFLPRDGRLRVLDFGLAKAVSESGESPSPEVPGSEDVPTVFLDEPAATLGGDGVPREQGLDSRVATRALAGPPQHKGPETEGICGTPAYMSPEQWRGQALGPAVDSWGLGLLLYELFSGRLPYGEGRGKGHARRVCHPDPVPRLEPREALPSGVLDVVHRCLEKSPTLRPSVEEVLRVLAEALTEGDGGRADSTLTPFRGLFPFDERHRRSFFGREAEIEEFVERLRLEPVIAVVGPSGAGKSSFVRAGVIPRLRERGPLIVLTLRPGRKPFQALAARMVEAERGSDSADPKTPFGTGSRLSGTAAVDRAREDREPIPDEMMEARELGRELERSPGLVNLRLHALAESRRASVLVVVDQLEELYALVPDAEARRRFMSALCQAADDSEAPVRVVLTLREEFLSRLAEGAGVREALAHVTVLRRPDREMLEAILTRPVEAAGYRYEDSALVQQMVDEVVESPACLPLVQFAGQMLWEGRNEIGRTLCWERYDEMGGVAGALARHADGVLAGLSDREVDVARRLVLRLVTSDGTRCAMARDAVLEELGSEAAFVLDRLVAARLIVARRSEKGGLGELELIHESLIANWGRLSRWIDESREDMAILSEMTQAAQLWERRGHRDDEVWSGDALREALRTAERHRERGQELPQLVLSFLDQGKKKKNRSARRRRALAVTLLLVLSVVIAVLGVLNREATRQRRRAEARRLEAEGRHAESLREGARAALAQGDLLEARAKLRGSLEIEDSVAARALWWRLEGIPLLWQDSLGIEHHQVAVSLDGRTVATSASAQSVQVFDARDGSVRLLTGHDDSTLGIAISPDIRQVAAGCFSGDVSLWDLISGEHWTLSGHEEVVWSLDFTRDGRTLVSGSYDGTMRFWDMVTKGVLTSVDGGAGPIRRVRLSPDGKRVAVGTRGGSLQLRALPRGDLLWARDAGEEVLALAFLPDGERVVTGGIPGDTIRIWDAERGELMEELPSGHQSAIESLDVSADGRLLATGSRDRTVTIRNPDGNAEVRIVPWEGEIHVLRFSPDGSYLAVTSDDDALRLWSPDMVERPEPLPGHRGLVWGVDFHPDGHTVASGASDGEVRLWDVKSGAVTRVLRGHQTTVHGVAFSPGGGRLVSGSSDGTARVWDVETGKTDLVLRGHERPVPAVLFSLDGRWVVTGGVDRTIRIWDSQTGSLASTLEGHTGPILDLAFSFAGDLLASVGYDGTVRLWDALSWAPLRVLRATEGYAYGVAFSPDGSRIAASCHDGSVRLWELPEETDRVLASFDTVPYLLRFHPDGERLAVPLQNGEIRIVSVADGTQQILSGHLDAAQMVAFDTAGVLMASSGHDGTVRLWDTLSGRPQWHGKGLLREAGAFLTHQGYRPLLAAGQERELPPWLPPVDEIDRIAENEEGLVCLAPWSGPLQVVDAAGVGESLQVPVDSVGQLLAIPSACVVRTLGGEVRLLGHSLGVRSLDVGGARWVGWDESLLTVLAGDEVHFFDPNGDLVQSLPANPGVSAAVRAQGSLVKGHSVGLVEASAGDEESILAFEGTPQSAVTELVNGPGGTVVAAFADGTVGLWDPGAGQALALVRLHGAVTNLWIHHGLLFAGSELGASLIWDLGPLEEPRCDLLEAVWERVPVVWEKGRPHIQTPPGIHDCR